MDEKERDEILYRLDERTKRVDEKLERLESRVNDNEAQITTTKEKVDTHSTTMEHIKWVVSGIGSLLVATVSGVAAKIGGVI